MELSPEEQFNTGLRFSKGIHGHAQDDVEAVQWFRKAADRGLDKAQHCLAYHYLIGLGVNKDANKALLWYQRAAEQGLVGSQFDLASLYFNGREIPPNLDFAKKWNDMAAAQGHPKANELQAKIKFAKTNIPLPEVEKVKPTIKVNFSKTERAIFNSAQSVFDKVTGVVKAIALILFIGIIWILVASIFNSCNLIHPD